MAGLEGHVSKTDNERLAKDGDQSNVGVQILSATERVEKSSEGLGARWNKDTIARKG